MFAYSYPLVGGLMLASSVYHLLYYNGNVLGISGIYQSSFAKALRVLRLDLWQKQPPSKDSFVSAIEQSVSITQNLANDNAAHPTKSPSDDNWKPAFIAGLLCGGILLRTFRAAIESGLGIPIFETSAIRGTSNPLFIEFLCGTLVGVGAKVIFLSVTLTNI
jgi:hypothetical protein